MAQLKILSLNVKGLNSPYKSKILWNDALKTNSDILCIQELHFTGDNPPKFSFYKFPHIFFSNYSKKKRGVITIIKDSVTFQLLDFKTNPQERFLIIIANIDNTAITIAN